ncbi:MAG: T9SS type A sorting domain-containing protein, partial [Chitinophagaceae bacterium]
ATSGGTNSSTAPIGTATDDALYQTERWGYNFGYAFPVTNGQYKVVLHFAEIYWTAPGKRVFDVAIEGVKKLDDYDIVAKTGAFNATTETFTVTVTDGSLDIDFNSLPGEGGADNAKVSAIEIVPAGTSANAAPVADAGTDKTITLPTSSVALNGSGTDADGTIASYAWTQVSGPNTAVFSSKTIAAPTVSGLAQGSYVFALVVKDNDGAASVADPVTVTVNAAAGGTVTYRINAGGPQLTTSIGTFAADNYFAPSPGNKTTSTAAIGNTTDDALYQTDRWASSFNYALPVANGQYNVVLHFAEYAVTTAGRRIFDVSMEGVKKLDNYDIVAKAGAYNAISETISVTVTDGLLNINFSSIPADGGKGYAKVSAIEVLSLNAQPANEPPVADAGTDKTITLPTNSTVLNGSGSDADGTIASYAWSQVSGPSTATFSSKTVAAPTVSGLVQGTYVFALVVKDNAGAGSTADEVTVTVNAAAAGTQALASFTLINADTDQDILTISNGATLNLATLPTRNLNIRANTSPTAVGSVVFNLSGTEQRSQTETSAPYALFGDNAGDFTAWSPATGSYTLTGTPYSGAGGSGTEGTALTVSFTVADQTATPPSNNVAPMANAGPDKVLTLPTSSVMLNGSVKDADGTVVSYVWSQVSGPGTAAFNSKTVLKPTVSGLVEGTYVFAFVATDNVGATSAPDQVTVTVNGAAVSRLGATARGEATASKAAVPDDVDIRLFPNPTTGGPVQLGFSKPVQGELTYMLYAPNGNRVLAGRKQLTAPTSTLTIQLGRAAQSSGIYFLEVQIGQRRQTIQVLVAN